MCSVERIVVICVDGSENATTSFECKYQMMLLRISK